MPIASHTVVRSLSVNSGKMGTLMTSPDSASLPPVHPLYEATLDEFLGVTGLPVRGPWKNLFFAGREVLPGLGIEGEFYAGIQAAGHVAALLGSKNPLK